MRFSIGSFRTLAAFCLALGLALGIASTRAHAQVLIIVNGSPITAYDIEQRSKLIALSTHKTPPRQQVIEELINEKLKLSVSRFYRMDVTDSEVEQSFSSMAQRMRTNSEGLTKMLQQSGIHVPSFKEKLRADIGWEQIIRGKFAGDFQFGEKDVMAIVDAKKTDEKDMIGYEYILRPVLFVVPRGAAPAVFEARKREAESLRARFQSCAESLPFARALKDVAVRDQIVRNSADMPPALREVMNNIPVGKLTPPEMTQNGVEMFALCGKRENRVDTPSKRQARQELIAEKFQAQAARYLKELRARAMIEYK
ncbi:MAG: SurA N-terminal domain-containing protein [Pseudorhodoplanes sp.]